MRERRGSCEQPARGVRGGAFQDKGAAGEKCPTLGVSEDSTNCPMRDGERHRERERDTEGRGDLSVATNVRGNCIPLK